jgi:hypothetical protein
MISGAAHGSRQNSATCAVTCAVTDRKALGISRSGFSHWPFSASSTYAVPCAVGPGFERGSGWINCPLSCD